MNCDCSLFFLNSIQKLLNNVIRRCRTIKEVQIKVLDAGFDELLFIVLGFVQPDYESNSKLFKDWDIVIRSERSILICHVQRPRKSHELTWHNPVQISVLHLLVMLVLLDVEILIAVPAETHSNLEALEGVLHSALVGAGAHGGVSEGNELTVIRMENLPRFVS